MKLRFVALLCGVGVGVGDVGAQAPASPASQRLTSRMWTVGGVQRTGLVATPVKPDSTNGSPLVFVFHGHGGTSLNISRTFGIHTAWPEAIVVYLQGLPTPGAIIDRQGRLPGWQSAPGANGDRDLKLFDVALAWAEKEHRVDRKRIYAAGHSNGGWFTYVLWAARGDTFAAVAPAAAVFGTMVLSAKPKPALIIAGRSDTVVPYANQLRSLRSVLRLDQCDSTGTTWAPNATRYSCKAGSEVVAYLYPGAHSLPKDAAESAVRFFKTHPGGRQPTHH